MKVNLFEEHTYEELANALYLKGKRDGYQKVTDKTKWREPVMAEKLGHTAHAKISAGKDSEKYGSDAYDASNGVFAEYKSSALKESELRNLFESPKPRGGTYAPLTVGGVYNGAYKMDAIESYSKNDHYFGVFYEEQCILIIRPKTEEVISQLTKNHLARKPGQTTNLNTVKIRLSDTSKYDVAYRNEEFFSKNS